MFKKEKLIHCLKNIKLSHDGLKVTELTLRFHQNNFKIKEIPISNQHNEDSRLIPNFSLLKPFPFLKVIMSNLLAIIELYYILKKENLDR